MVRTRTSIVEICGKPLSAGWAILITWGPRALLDGYEGVRGRWPARKHMMFSRAAELVLDLAGRGQRVDVKHIMSPSFQQVWAPAFGTTRAPVIPLER